MRIALLPALLGVALLAAGSAQAEDFTGFYAGVNAGYAFSRGGSTRPVPAAEIASSASKGTESALPPSAAEAARRMPAVKLAPALPR